MSFIYRRLELVVSTWSQNDHDDIIRVIYSAPPETQKKLYICFHRLSNTPCDLRIT